MGMYTEICIAVEIKQDTPEQVIDTIKWLAGGDSEVATTVAKTISKTIATVRHRRLFNDY